MKTCTQCNIAQPLDRFHKKRASADGHQEKCKTCRSKNSKKHYHDNIDAIKAQRTPEIRRRWNIKYKYGITIEEYESMLADQDNKCCICKKTMDKPVIDHDHKTLKIRGILCSNCNVAIGLLEDNKTNLFNAIAYLSRK